MRYTIPTEVEIPGECRAVGRTEPVHPPARSGETRRVREHHDSWGLAPDSGQYHMDSGLSSMSNDLLMQIAAPGMCGRAGSRRHGACPPYYQTEGEHLLTVDGARLIEGMCPNMVSVYDVLVAYSVSTGGQFNVQPRVRGQHKGLVAKAQTVLDRWQKDVNFPAWQPELFRRRVRDGEAILVLEPSEEAHDLLEPRSVEPDQLRQPQGIDGVNRELRVNGANTSWRYGVLTSRRNTAKPLGYWICDDLGDGAYEGAVYDPWEVWHLKPEWIDRQSKRGVPDAFSVVNDVARVRKLLRSLVIGGTVQSNIGFVVEHPEGYEVEGPREPDLSPSHRTPAGEETPAFQFGEPRRLDVPHGFQYKAGPMAGGGRQNVLVQVLQAGLRGVGTRWCFPEGLISGDQSNNALASALMSEAPFCHCMIPRQFYFFLACITLLERVLDHAAVIGQLGTARENVLDDIKVTVEPPPMVARKLLDETQRCAVLSEHGQLSPRTWSGREELDRDEELENMEDDPTPPVEMHLIGAPGPEAESERIT